jgi:hypothetical protein
MKLNKQEKLIFNWGIFGILLAVLASIVYWRAFFLWYIPVGLFCILLGAVMEYFENR